jgi:hypothetical protein
LSPYWQEEKALDALVHHIGSFRREPLRQGSDPTPTNVILIVAHPLLLVRVLDRKALLADFPVVARL